MHNRKMAKDTLKNLQDFKRMFGYFSTLHMKGLKHRRSECTIREGIPIVGGNILQLWVKSTTRSNLLLLVIDSILVYFVKFRDFILFVVCSF